MLVSGARGRCLVLSEALLATIVRQKMRLSCRRGHSISVCISDGVAHRRLIVGHQFAATPRANATLVAPSKLFRHSLLLKGREAVVAANVLFAIF